jgi:hypothetical protein
MDSPPSSELSQLSLLLENDLELIATGSNDIQNAALLATQSLFDHCKFCYFSYYPFLSNLLPTQHYVPRKVQGDISTNLYCR